MPRKTQIGTEVAHVTRDWDTTFKVKGQGHQAALLTAVLAHQAAAAMGVRTCMGNCCYVAVCSAARGVSAPTEGRGERRVHILAAARLQLVYIISVRGANRLWGEKSIG